MKVVLSKELSPEEELIYRAGRRDALMEFAAWAKTEQDKIREKWRQEGPKSVNAEGFSGHTQGLWQTHLEALRRAKNA